MLYSSCSRISDFANNLVQLSVIEFVYFELVLYNFIKCNTRSYVFFRSTYVKSTIDLSIWILYLYETRTWMNEEDKFEL